MRITILTIGLLCILSRIALASVTIGGVTYDHVDPGPAFTEEARPVQDWQPPKASRAETAAGTIAYVPGDPGEFKPFRIPRPSERVDRLSALLTPGEDRAVWFGVFALEALQGLDVAVDVGNAPLKAEVRHMHFWPQRAGGYSTRVWHWVPELLLPCKDGRTMYPVFNGVYDWRDFDVKSRETAALWLTITAAKDARPGIYTAKVTVSAKGRKTLTLPMTVDVLPFALKRPADRSWLLYADAYRWNNVSDSVVMAELRDFARHGITGLVELPLGTADLSGIKSGRVTFDASQYKRLARMAREAGISGPHVVNCGYENAVRDALGLTDDLSKPWPQAVSDGVAAVAKSAVEATRDEPAKWYWYGWDEPGGDNLFAVQQYQAWHRGGAQTYATFYQLGFLDKASEYLTAPCFGAGLVSTQEQAKAAYNACKKTGAEFWWYGTGCYIGQDEAMFPNRYGTGYLFWKTRAKAEVTWTFQRIHEDAFNDFDGILANPAEPKDQCTAYPIFTKPGDYSTYQGAMPTITWESVREGINDYTYLSMLQSLIDECGKSGNADARRAGKAAADSLVSLDTAIPWGNEVGDSGFNCLRMNQVRRVAATQIAALQDALAGRGVRTGGFGAAEVTLAVDVTGPGAAAAASRPVISIPRASAAPKIDGSLDDPCWKTAAKASDFRFVDNGAPEGPAHTLAMTCYDDSALYVAFSCQEPAMDRLVARQSGRDQSGVWLDDGIELFIDPTGRREKYAHFIVNTNGSLYEEIGQDPTWNPDIQYQARKRADGYDVELAIPWAALEAAGFPRSEAMALNFCRNRYAGSQQTPHTAWACTFGGFHEPGRFGVGLLEEAPVALAGIELPTLWGPQEAAVRVRNLTDKPVQAFVRAGTDEKRVELAPAQEREVRFAMDLRTPGKSQLALAWGVVGSEGRQVSLGIETPEPLQMPGGAWFLGSGGRAEAKIAANIAPANLGSYSLRLRTNAAGKTDLVTMPLAAGKTWTRQLSLPSGTGSFEVVLVDASGRRVAAPLKGRIFALPGE